MVKGRKAKGSSAERELLDKLFSVGFAVIRAAGSGSTSHDACDLVAGRAGKSYAIEVKACAGKKQYISSEQMQELFTFSKAFGAQSIVAVKFTRKGWFVLAAGKLKRTGKLYGVSKEEMHLLDDWIKAETIGFDIH